VWGGISCTSGGGKNLGVGKKKGCNHRRGGSARKNPCCKMGGGAMLIKGGNIYLIERNVLASLKRDGDNSISAGVQSVATQG